MPIQSLLPLILLTLIFSAQAFLPPNASAGFLDKLNEATQKLNQKNQQMQQGKQAVKTPKTEAGDRPLHLEDHYTGSCEGKRSATCMDYMELADQCMDPLKGYRMKLTADLIEKKLKDDKTLNDKQRKNLEEDLAAAREAHKNKTDNPTIAGVKNSQRHLQDISEEDQVYINAEYNIFYKKIYNKCMGADHMGIGKRTEMMQDTETMSGEEAVAQLRKERAKEQAPFDCLKNISGLRFEIQAQMMEEKMNANKNMSAQERKEWEEDIASIRALPGSGQMMPAPADPKNPARALMRLSTDDQIKLNERYGTESQAAIAKCSEPATKPKERKPKSKGLVDHSKSPANKSAKKVEKKQYADLNYGRGGSTNLLALRRDNVCYDQLKGHFAKVHAEALEKKYKAAKGLSAQDKKEWEEDIASWRAAQAAGADQAEPADPDNPYRWQDRLTKEERQQINMTHNAFNTKIITECGNRPSGL